MMHSVNGQTTIKDRAHTNEFEHPMVPHGLRMDYGHSKEEAMLSVKPEVSHARGLI